MKYYGKYRGELGSANAQQVLNKNNEAWSSFFSLLKLRKEGKLPPHMNHVSPPSYWKDGETGGRKLMLVVRQDNYVVDERNHIILKYFNMKISFTGKLRWHGKQGRLEIYYDEMRNAWYASIPVEVGVEETRMGRKSKHIVRGRGRAFKLNHRRVIKQRP